MKTAQYIVRQDETTMSLLAFLADRLDISKKKAKHLLNARNVFVNRRRIWMARHPLKQHDKVEIVDILEPADRARSRNRSTILFEDDDYLIINKRAGIVSNGPNSLEDRIKAQFDLPLLSVAHRLDKDTSGCLLFAKHKRSLESVLPLFRRHRVKKCYHVIASGRLRPSVQTITTPIEGRRVITHLKTLDSNKDASHLVVTIQTGRIHQIRKHLDSIRHPVLGDRHYETASRLPQKVLHIGRHMLHASKLEFDHPATERKVRVKAPLPRDFRSCLKRFRLT